MNVKNMMLGVAIMLLAIVFGAIPVAAQGAELGALACFTGAMCILPVILLIIAIVLCVWTYKDAQKRGMNAVLWLIVVLIAGIIGLIIYLVVRRDHPIK